jgi:hypothetical protein
MISIPYSFMAYHQFLPLGCTPMYEKKVMNFLIFYKYIWCQGYVYFLGQNELAPISAPVGCSVHQMHEVFHSVLDLMLINIVP